MWIKDLKNLFKKYNEIDLVEARDFIDHEILTYRRISYEEFITWIKDKKIATYEIKGRSGIEYQVEIYAFWDDRKSGTIRVQMSIDGGPISPSKPISTDFIKGPDNSFIGE